MNNDEPTFETIASQINGKDEKEEENHFNVSIKVIDFGFSNMS